MKYIITYNDAVEITKAYDNFNFSSKEYEIDGYRIVTFNYFLCEYNFFVHPLKEKDWIHAKDMRGVTFVFNKDGSLYKRFLMFEKFFNVNQVEETQIHLLREKKIKHVTYKEDGSLIAFMNLPNGRVFAKTQAGFDNEQANRAMELYNHQDGIKKFVDDALEIGHTPLFEYVAYDNRIVLKYKGRELRLIGLRDNFDAKYYSVAEMGKLNIAYDIPHAKVVDITSIDELEHLVNTATDIEGVVVEFEDGQLVKWKTAWYFNLHGIRTENIFREDFVIKHFLEGTLDDVTQELNMTDDADAFKFIDRVKKATLKWSNLIEKEVNTLVELYNNLNGFYFGNWVKFATDNHKKTHFGLARTKIEKPELYKIYKIEYMIKAAKHLLKAKKIIEKYESDNM